MICEIYSVKDELNGSFHNPIFLQTGETTEREALRIFRSQMINTPVWKDSAQDFTLYYLGAFDTITGDFKNEKKEIINGRSVKE